MHIYRTRREEVQPWHYHFNFQVVDYDLYSLSLNSQSLSISIRRLVSQQIDRILGYKWFTGELDGRQTLRRSIKRVAGVKRNPAPVYYCSLSPDDRLVYLEDRRQTDLMNYMDIERIIDKKK